MKNLRSTLEDLAAVAGVDGAGVLLPTRQCLKEGSKQAEIDSALRLLKESHQLMTLHQMEPQYALWNFQNGWLWSLAVEGHIYAVVSKTNTKDCPADQLFAIIQQGR